MAGAFLVENYDPIGALGYWRRGELRFGSWLTSLRRADELAWFARDDLRPFGLMCLRMGCPGSHPPLYPPAVRSLMAAGNLITCPAGQADPQPRPARFPRVPAALPQYDYIPQTMTPGRRR